MFKSYLESFDRHKEHNPEFYVLALSSHHVPIITAAFSHPLLCVTWRGLGQLPCICRWTSRPAVCFWGRTGSLFNRKSGALPTLCEDPSPNTGKHGSRYRAFQMRRKKIPILLEYFFLGYLGLCLSFKSVYYSGVVIALKN